MATKPSTRTSRAALVCVFLAAPGYGAASPHLTDPSGGGYYVYADVVDVSPRYGWREVVEPVRHCVEVVEPRRSAWNRRRDRYREEGGRHDGGRDAAAGLVGGLIGGLIGNQFGGGDGKKALTVAGALLGASVAQDHARRRDLDDRYRRYDAYPYAERPAGRRCTQTERTRRVRGVNGYDVTYRYQGATFHKWVDDHPGDAIRVHVAVEPME